MERRGCIEYKIALKELFRVLTVLCREYSTENKSQLVLAALTGIAELNIENVLQIKGGSHSMHVKKAVIPVAVALVFFWVTSVFAGHGAKSANKTEVIAGGEQVTISGTILDSHQEQIG
jgi:hypothetical protein